MVSTYFDQSTSNAQNVRKLVIFLRFATCNLAFYKLLRQGFAYRIYTFLCECVKLVLKSLNTKDNEMPRKFVTVVWTVE